MGVKDREIANFGLFGAGTYLHSKLSGRNNRMKKKKERVLFNTPGLKLGSPHKGSGQT